MKNYIIRTKEKRISKKQQLLELSFTAYTIGHLLHKNDLVMIASTVSPKIVPSLIEVLTHESGLEAGKDFFIQLLTKTEDRSFWPAHKTNNNDFELSSNDYHKDTPSQQERDLG
ncbi:hypothetical protein EBU24_03905 [bacterium]|nr:hypothetical protein [bacterium]